MIRQLRRHYTLVLALAAPLASGCVVRSVLPESYDPPPPQPVVTEVAEPGAIFRSGTDLRLFEDLRAHRVGDILTVRLNEAMSATKSSSTSTSKSTSLEHDGPTLFGRPVTLDGVPVLTNSLSGDQSFEGAGDSSQSNSLQGDITVTVVERLANGNLRIRGEKWVTINQGREFIRVSGIVRPFDIEPDNSIPSTKVADARIAYSGRGVLAAANRQGWLQRFLSSVLNPL